MAIWDYIHGFASCDQPELITFYDQYDHTLYRNLAIKTVGEHGWELVSVVLGNDPETQERRYEYFFKRDRSAGYDDGIARHQNN